MTAPAIGIDCATTYFVASVWNTKTQRADIIINDQGNRSTPSYVSFTSEGRLIGDGAKNNAVFNPRNTIFDAKRLIGRKFDDPVVQEDLKLWPFKVINKDNRPYIEVEYLGETKHFSPEEITAMLIRKMVDHASEQLGQKVTKAVITVPAYFNDAQRSATKDAAMIVGVEVLRIVNEPTAAAIAASLDKCTGTEKVLVHDIGGGTTDCTLMEISDGLFSVLSTAGCSHLGGMDFDNRLVRFLASEFKRLHKEAGDILCDPRALRRLQTAAERAKRELSTAVATNLDIENLFGGIDFHYNITRARFEDICGDLFRQALEPLDIVLRDAKVAKSEVTRILSVGGSSRMPRIKSSLMRYFNDKPLEKDVDPDCAIAMGAAIQAAILTDVKDTKLADKLLVDVCPLSIGIETMGGINSIVIKRNTALPTSKEEIFSTASDNQPAVTIVVVEGERSYVRDCNVLGKFDLTGIAPAPRGTPQIVVKLDISTEGILTVTATEKSSGRTSNIKIKSDQGRLTPEAIERAVKDAEKHKAEDAKRAELTNLRNQIFHLSGSLPETQKTDVLSWLDAHPDASRDQLESKLRELTSSRGTTPMSVPPSTPGPKIDEVD